MRSEKEIDDKIAKLSAADPCDMASAIMTLMWARGDDNCGMLQSAKSRILGVVMTPDVPDALGNVMSAAAIKQAFEQSNPKYPPGIYGKILSEDVDEIVKGSWVVMVSNEPTHKKIKLPKGINADDVDFISVGCGGNTIILKNGDVHEI